MRTRSTKLAETVSKDASPKTVYEKVPEILCRIHTRPITRSLTKCLNKEAYNFVIVEHYRSMPLLGDEEEIIPKWDVHIARWAIVFI